MICDTSTFELETSEAGVNITVTNDFIPAPEPEAEPAAAEAVEAAPTFTG